MRILKISGIKFPLKSIPTITVFPRIFIAQIYLFLMLTPVSFSLRAQNASHTFIVQNGHFLLDGKPFIIRSGEMHYPRVPREYWRHRFQMMRALGLNTVATYVFWNYHNIAPGKWDFKTGNRNLAEYIKTAQEEGLFVILRPGPYVCAEWEFGGYPWWLQKNKKLVVRSSGPFLDSCNVYIEKLADQVKNLQITHGGPIILVQVENEFGSYVAQRKDISETEHRNYYLSIKNMLEKAGFDTPFFTSDGSWLFNGGAIPGVLPTANGEGNIQNLIESVNKYHSGEGPYMVAEYYPGWLDHWGEPFIRVSTDDVVKQVDLYLKNNISFNFYMVHGGTNFGFTSGANYTEGKDIQPDITSYDYDAPINESGWPTKKYSALRELIQKYSQNPLPPVPDKIKTIKIPDIKLNRKINLFDLADNIKPVISESPLTFEDLDQGYGYIIYSRKFQQALSGKLNIPGLRDFATVYVNGKRTGILNRASNLYSIDISIPKNGSLEILVENMGRINYGAQITENTKGILSGIKINNEVITGNWKMYSLPMDKPPVYRQNKSLLIKESPAIYYGLFEISEAGDTFLDMSSWNKGLVFVNGHNLGKYWDIGPQQTLYLPGCWLHKGKNEIVIFEQLNNKVHEYVSTSEIPILEHLSQ